MIDVALEIIQEYIQDNLFDQERSWDKREFKMRSYSRWAAYELMNRIMDNPLDMPINVIDSFILEMAAYSNYGEDGHRSLIFQVAQETAEDIILLFV